MPTLYIPNKNNTNKKTTFGQYLTLVKKYASLILISQRKFSFPLLLYLIYTKNVWQKKKNHTFLFCFSKPRKLVESFEIAT